MSLMLLPATMFGVALGVSGDAVAIVAGATNDSSPLIVGVLALVGGAAGAQIIQSWQRRKSGEDKSAAAQDVAHAASEMAGAVTDITQPLRAENLRLHQLLVERQNRLLEKTEEIADLRVEVATLEAEFEKRRHIDASEITVKSAELETARLVIAEREQEISDLLAEAGRLERRSGHTRRAPEPPAAT